MLGDSAVWILCGALFLVRTFTEISQPPCGAAVGDDQPGFWLTAETLRKGERVLRLWERQPEPCRVWAAPQESRMPCRALRSESGRLSPRWQGAGRPPPPSKLCRCAVVFPV